MKLFPFLSLILLVSTKAEDLTTTDGKTYTNVKVTKVEPDGLRILHDSGTAKVPFDKLSDEIQKRHGYDPFNAYDHAQADKAKQAEIAKAEAARAQATEAKRAQQAKQAKAAAADQQAMEKAKQWGKMMQMSRHPESVHVADGMAQPGGDPSGKSKTRGVTVNVAAGTLGKVPVMKGKMKTGEQEGWIFSKSKTLAYVDDAPVSTSMRDGRILSIDGQEQLYPIGLARFTDLSGSKKTLPRYTADLRTAAAFYAAHSYPPFADTVVTDLTGAATP